jgi:hypothetical protein
MVFISKNEPAGCVNATLTDTASLQGAQRLQQMNRNFPEESKIVAEE